MKLADDLNEYIDHFSTLQQRSVVAIDTGADKPYATSDNAHATARDPS